MKAALNETNVFGMPLGFPKIAL
ncbi:MAG: hypothetical protein JWQ17_2061, partial [Tardiphaga sp.]|nr:hypothetical protein [Tardiphaga sp.]